MQMNPYLLFNGQCEEAFKFYEKCFGGKIVAMLPHEGAPGAEHLPAEWRKKIMHAYMVVGDQALMGSDPPPQYYQEPKGFSVSLMVKQLAEAESVFHALAEGGQVKMPIQQTFWSPRFGMLVDKFGIPWMVNCEQAAPQAAGSAA